MPLSALTSVLDSRARREEGVARMAVVPFAPAAAAVVPEDAPGLVPAFEKLLADPPRVARSDDPRMALGKLHFYVLAKRMRDQWKARLPVAARRSQHSATLAGSNGHFQS